MAYNTKFGIWPRKDPITLELVLKPEKIYSRQIPHILSLCDELGQEVMYVGQWKDFLIARLMETSRLVEAVEREVGAGGIFNTGETVFLTLVLNKGSVHIYRNGQLERESKEFDFYKAVLYRPIRSIVFGNSSDANDSWQGEILHFSAFNSALNSDTIRRRYIQWRSINFLDTSGAFIRYRFEELEGKIIRNERGNGWDLHILETLIPLRKKMLSLPSTQYIRERSFYKDVIINVVGFIPLGLLLAIFFSGISLKKYAALNFIIPVMVGGLLSLFIEINQVFLFSRNSSMIDLVLNTLGSGIGVVFYWGKSML